MFRNFRQHMNTVKLLYLRGPVDQVKSVDYKEVYTVMGPKVFFKPLTD